MKPKAFTKEGPLQIYKNQIFQQVEKQEEGSGVWGVGGTVPQKCERAHSSHGSEEKPECCNLLV